MVDVNKPVENPSLVAAMEALHSTPNAETEAALFAELKTANFLLVLEKGINETPDENGKITLTKGTVISISMLSDYEGRPLHFGFTDWRALYAWREQANQQTLIMPIEHIADMVLKEGTNNAGFLINPSTHNFFIPPNILAHVSGRPNPYTVQKDTQVLLGEPKDYPYALVEAVKATIKPMHEIKRAWLLLMSKEGEQSFLIVIEHTGDRATVSRAVGTAAMPHLPKGMFVDIVTTEQDFGKNAVKNHKPFFKRGLFG